YYDLEKAREDLGARAVAIVRIERLYPLADDVLLRALETYRDGTSVVWVQEEPQNMGAWSYLRARFGETLLKRFPLSVMSRPASATPARDSPGSHKLEQQQLIAEAFRS